MDPKFMKRAIELACQNVNSNNGGPFGCVVVCDGKIIGEGANSVTKTNDPTAHGEIIAIRQACQNLNQFSLKGCDLYTSCEPCPMCLAATYWARVDKVYFSATQEHASKAGFDDEFLYKEFKASKDQRSLKLHACLTADAHLPFDVWAASTDKTEY